MFMWSSYKMPRAAIIEKKKQHANEELKSELAKVQAQLAIVNDERDRLKTEVVTLQADNIALGNLEDDPDQTAIARQKKTDELSTENLQLSAENETLKQDLDAAKGDLSKATDRIKELEGQLKQTSPVLPVVIESPALGHEKSVARRRLINLAGVRSESDKKFNDYFLKQMKTIDGTTDLASMENFNKELAELTRITKVVNLIVDNLKGSSKWYQQDPTKKINGILKAFHDIPVDERTKLIKAVKSTPNSKEEFPVCNSFLKELQTQRSSHFKSDEAKSFNSFKTKMTEMQEKVPIDSGTSETPTQGKPP